MRKVELVAASSKNGQSDGPVRKKKPSLEYSDDKEDEINPTGNAEVRNRETELQLYLEAPKEGFWQNNKAVFPRLYAITRKMFCVPAITGFILSSKRLSLTDVNFSDPFSYP